jgi:hypothetical protein
MHTHVHTLTITHTHTDTHTRSHTLTDTLMDKQTLLVQAWNLSLNLLHIKPYLILSTCTIPTRVHLTA